MDLNKIPGVTLVSVSCIKHYSTLKALMYSSRVLEFEKIKFITNIDRKDFNQIKVPENIEIINIGKDLRSKDDYSEFMLYEYKNYIDTNHALNVQYDGFIINPQIWNPGWLEYDYIGAPFPPFYRNRENVDEIVRVGNGGFSLRSKKFINLFSELNLPILRDGLTGIAEDHQQCCMYHSTYKNAGIKYAPVEVAVNFAHENFTLTEEVKKEITPFGFHTCRGYQGPEEFNNFYYPYFNE